MANGSIESKSESNVWPADDSTQTQPSSRHHQDSGTPVELNDSPQATRHFPSLPRPPSPVSVAELQERAAQDSQNNNVDENSNDRHYDQYAAAAAAAAAYPSREVSFHPAYSSQEATHFAYHNQEFSSYPAYLSQETSCPSHSIREASSHLNRESSSQQSRETSHTLYSSQAARSLHPNRETTHSPYLTQEAPSHHSSQDVSHPGHPSHSGCEAALQPDQSVRPRVRQPPQHYRDEPDRTPLPHQPLTTRRGSDGSSSNWQHSELSHRRNRCDGIARYPPLPNLNRPTSESERLPHHPGYGTGSHDHPSSQELLPLALGGGRCNSHPSLALRSAERVSQEAEELLTTFTSETLRNNRLEVPQWMRAMPSPQMVQAGRELRLLADAFACTAERRKVRVMAESVNLGCIEMDDFFQLCAELFYDGITRERIVALFTFVGDVAVHQVRMKGEELIHRLMKWSLKYLVEYVCRWVQEAGGWIAVLTCGANFLYRCAVFVFCVCGSVAAGLFIYKTLKNG